MTQVTCDISVSLDGISAGVDQTVEHPFGEGLGDDAERLHAWMFQHAQEHRAEVDAITTAGAYVMGRRMFVPGSGRWDPGWRGWWGADPPYHAPVFVLTHHVREPLVMDGGTTFHFVDAEPGQVLDLARAAAGGRDVSVAGGATTVNAFLAAGLIDELRMHVVPWVAGIEGVRLFEGVGPRSLRLVSSRSTPDVAHLVLRR